MHKIEFKPGDFVTYKPYEKAYERVVLTIRPYQNVYGQKDERVWYGLGNPDDFTKTHVIVTTESTGICIKESIYFQEHDKDGKCL